MKTSNRGAAAAALSAVLAVIAVVWPHHTARALGLPTPKLAQAAGAQEGLAAVGLAIRPHSPGLLWFRAAGDVAHLGMLATAFTRRDARRGRLGVGMAAAAAALTADVRAARQQTDRVPGGALHTRATVTINRPTDEVYRMWRELDRLPDHLSHVSEVTETDETRSHWEAVGPLGTDIEWDAEIVDDQPGTRLAWHSVGDTLVPNSGIVSFQPHASATEITVDLEFSLPAGGAAATLTRLFGEHPDQQLDDDLRRFKQVAETGEVLRSDGSPAGTRLGDQLGQRPARPVST